MEDVRVRFAPSPTGFLHVGGARTAIFNWLFAKNKNGKFLLRIEDTDSQRSKSELSEQIVRSLSWLGMDSDELIVYQSDRIDRYREIVKLLVNEKKAYYSFETAEELELQRKKAQQKKIPFKYNRSALKLNDKTIKKYLDEGKPFTVRFFVQEGVTEFNDIVHGKTIFENSELDDFVILRSDGSPVYQIAVVVDDYDMNITHIIRGDDHLSNTPKQILLYKALGWNIPQFAHLPMILDENKKKLSKRRDTVAVEEYQKMGYLPEALFNFLTLLGFAPTNNREIVSRDELVDMYTFDRVNKKSAVFDMKKLNWLNSEYIKMSEESKIAELVKEQLIKSNLLSIEKINEFSLQFYLNIIRLMKERVSTINDFIFFGKYFFVDPEEYDKKGIEKYSNEQTKMLLKEYADSLSGSAFDTAVLENNLRQFAESKKVKAADIIHPLRLALTGMNISPGIFELMEVLGKEKVLKRIKKFIKDTA
jgi:glutamyl-tRNA synthetase